MEFLTWLIGMLFTLGYINWKDESTKGKVLTAIAIFVGWPLILGILIREDIERN